MGRIENAFAAARDEGRAAFVAYLPAGFPDDAGFLRHARALLEHADVLEVGLPFSDPLGDGPTIQRASERALRQGTTTRRTFELVAELREGTDKPLLVMTYYNPIYCHPGGDRGFLEALAAAGGDGVILPDLPPEEAGELIPAARELGLATVFLAAPTSTPERLRRVGAASRGFVYAVSVTGVTGARDAVSADLPDLIARIREAGELPVAVGFGVSGAATAGPVAAVADGVVVGSALVRAIEEGGDVTALAAEIAAACRREQPVRPG